MSWKVPLFDLNVDEEEVKAATDVLRSRWISMGDVTRQFEGEFARRHGTKHAVAVSNCTAGLHLALRATEIKEGDEVICPSLTFVATANSILYVGAIPIFTEITSYGDLTISPEDIEKKITEKTRALVVVHYGGWPCDMGKIGQIAMSHGLTVIEDAAHAPFAEYSERKVGTFGDVGCFSFFSNKNMTAAEGGMVTTNHDEIADKIRLMRSHGMTAISFDRFTDHATNYDVVELGFNYRLDDIRSSIGLVQLRKVVSFNRIRKGLTELYLNKLRDVQEVTIPFRDLVENRSERLSSYHIFPMLITANEVRRDSMREQLAGRGVQTSIHYQPVHLFRLYRERFGYKRKDLPLTEWVADREVTLPLYPGMKEEDVIYVADSVKECLATARRGQR